MGLTDKKKLSSKENLLKMKSHRLRFSNVKDFHGRRQHTSENQDRFFKQESANSGILSDRIPVSTKDDFVSLFIKDGEYAGPNELFCAKTIKTSTGVIIPLKCLPEHNLFSLSKHLSDLSLQSKSQIKGAQISNSVTCEPRKPILTFSDHLNQWTKEFCQPLTTSSTSFEFDMPYCYSEEFYSQVSAKYYMAQPFGSIGEPPVVWNSHVDVWYEKAQLALQYYRRLCVQPSRLPAQMITIKRSVAQFMAEQCALLGTELYFDNHGVRIGTNIFFQEKNKPTVFLIPDHENTLKQQECTEMQLKSDPIYTSSWQN